MLIREGYGPIENVGQCKLAVKAFLRVQAETKAAAEAASSDSVTNSTLDERLADLELAEGDTHESDGGSVIEHIDREADEVKAQGQANEEHEVGSNST